MSQTAQMDLRQWIDQLPLGRYQLFIIALCGLALFMDGFDAQAAGFVAPALARDLQIGREALGPVFSSSLVGIMLGALVFGTLADRVGRRPILILCTLWFGVGSLLTALAGSFSSLVVFRLITGLGLGGTMPNAIALTAEYMPTRFRATAVTLTFCGFSIGAASGGFVAAGLIGRFGWQAVFVAGGIVPCVLAALFVALLPESIRFLIAQGGQDSKIARCLAKLSPDFAATGRAVAVTSSPHDAPDSRAVKQLLAAGRRRLTLVLWLIFFMSLLDLYLLNNWLPTVIHDAGIPLERAIVLTALFQVGGTAGALVLGRLLDRYLSLRVLAWTYLGAAVCVSLIGVAGNSAVWLAGAILAAGFTVIGGQNGANALAAESYPTALRSTGVGWALGVGRIGSIIGPLFGGLLLSLRMPAAELFLAAAIPALAAAAAAFLGRGESRESTSSDRME